MRFEIFAVAIALGLATPVLHAREIDSGDPCERVQKIVTAAQCVEKGCPDPTGENKGYYEFFCRAREEGDGGTTPVRATITNSANFDLALPVIQNSDQNIVSGRVIETQPTGKLLTPCECLAFLDKLVKEKNLSCPVELCKPPEEPKQPEQPVPPNTAADPPKVQTGAGEFKFEGGGCTLTALSGFSGMGTWLGLFAAAAALGFRRRK